MDEADHLRVEQPGADAHEHAREDQQQRRRGERREQRRQGEQAEAETEHAGVPEQVTGTARRDEQQSIGEGISREDPLQIPVAGTQTMPE